MTAVQAPVRSSWVVHDGQLLNGGVSLPVTTQGLHYGTGVFEGIRAHAAPDGDELLLFRAPDHYARLHRSARLLRLELEPTAAQLTELTVDLLKRGGRVVDTYVRPIVYKLALLPGTRPGVALRGVSTSYSIVTFPLGRYVEGGLRCCFSSWVRPPQQVIPVQAKVTGAYVNAALACDEAREAGYDDAILSNTRGEIAEATTANVFTVTDGVLHTPPVTADALAGITRDTVFTLARDRLGLIAREQTLGRVDLLLADEVFLTGTGTGIAPVTEISGRPIGDGKPGRVTVALQDSYQQAVLGLLSEYEHWITRVQVDGGPR